jgi:phytoene synthase
MTMGQGEDFCLSLLREADPVRYFACLYLPPDLRTHASAIYAFNVEISRIADLVSEPAPGEVRLQWWREVITGEREPGNNPVAIRLLTTIGQCGLPHKTLIDYIDARVFDLYHDPMPDRQTLEAYCGETASALLRLVAICSKVKPDAALDNACGHGGVAMIVARLLQFTAALNARQRCYVTGDILYATGLTAQGWLSNDEQQKRLNAVAAMSALAREHYAEAVSAVANLEPGSQPLFLPLAPVPATLDLVRKTGPAIFREVPEITPLRLQWQMWKAAVFGFSRALRS